MCTVENYVAFIDANGCWEYAQAVKKGYEDTIGDRRSLLIAVDHSMAAAPILNACDIYGKEQCGIIMFDSHFDGILPSYRCGLIQYDIDTNPQSHFDPNDPFVFSRSESFNADSFLFKLIDEKLIDPTNVIIAGVSDYPSAKTSKIPDERVQRFLEFYRHYEDLGVQIVPKERIAANPRAFDPSKLDVSALHVSVDIDVGSRNALFGARFIDYKGLSHAEIMGLISKVKACKAPIVSADICEIDVWKAGLKHYGKQDNTYGIATQIGNALYKA
jgi:arginase family enzyme